MLSAAPRAVIITGGAAGIGRATARRFAAGGDRVAILDRDAAAAAACVAELGEGHLAYDVDVADHAGLARAISAAREGLGHVDVLVNNAAVIAACSGPILDLNLPDYQKLMAVNVLGAQAAAREVADILRRQGGGGAIVNVASLAGLIAVPNRTAYSVSKAAVIGLTRGMACQWNDWGIRVNAVLPGFTATETYRALQRDRKVDADQVERRIPMGRLAEPDEIAAAIHHLASPEASFTAGAMLTVDGGFQSYGGTADASAGGAAPPRRAAKPRVAIITGAGSAITAAVAARLAGSGARLILVGPDREALAAVASDLPTQAVVLKAGALDQGAADAAAKTALTTFGRLDLLVNVGHHPSTTLAASLDESLTGALMMMRACAPAMIRQGGGAIVNVCAPTGGPGSGDPQSHYAVRTAMAMLTRSAACEWARDGVRVNVVMPGDLAMRGRCLANGRDPVDGVASAIAFLGSDEASYVTGTTYLVDGGDAAQVWRGVAARPAE